MGVMEYGVGEKKGYGVVMIEGMGEVMVEMKRRREWVEVMKKMMEWWWK